MQARSRKRKLESVAGGGCGGGEEGEQRRMCALPGRPGRLGRLQRLRAQAAAGWAPQPVLNVRLRARDREVCCNSTILAEESEFFDVMFSSPEFGNHPSMVQFPDLDGEILELCTRSLLTSEILLHSGNIERVLHCATLLQLAVVKVTCCQYLQDTLDEQHAVRTLLLAIQYSCEDIKHLAGTFIATNFGTLCPNALVECTQDVLYSLITRNDLSVMSEVQVLSAITKWCEENRATEDQFRMLFGAVRLKKMATHELHSIQQHGWLKFCPDLLGGVSIVIQAATHPSPACRPALFSSDVQVSSSKSDLLPLPLYLMKESGETILNCAHGTGRKIYPEPASKSVAHAIGELMEEAFPATPPSCESLLTDAFAPQEAHHSLSSLLKTCSQSSCAQTGLSVTGL